MIANMITRRDFIKRTGVAAAGAYAFYALPLQMLQAKETVENPLAFYPNRDWEQLYRDQYKYDSSFYWICAPNDTHNCRASAYLRNGVIVRMGDQYDVGRTTDLYGNKASWNWGTRQCAKGYTFHRIVYGPYRL